MDEWIHSLWLGNILLLVVLAAKLVRTRLFLRYRAFFVLVCFLAVRNAVVELIAGQTVASFWFWLVTEPMMVLSFVMAVFETYWLALQCYVGLRTFSSHVLSWSLVIASLVSILSIFPDLQFNAAPDNNLFLLTNVIRRGVYTSLLAFLVLLLVGITVYPVRMNRNSILHAMLFTLLFLSHSATILAVNFQGVDFVPIANAAFALTASLAFLGWIAFLSPSGESVQRSVRTNLSEEEAARMMTVIQRMNDAIADTRKRV